MLSKGNEEQAIKRAKNCRGHNQKSGDDWKTRPSTNFDELIEDMKKFIVS